jgi:hypothetical protein
MQCHSRGHVGAEELVVIVNPAAAPISKEQLADLYLARSSALIPIDQAAGSAIYVEFYRKATGRDSAQVKAIWSRILFTGRYPAETAARLGSRQENRGRQPQAGWLHREVRCRCLGEGGIAAGLNRTDAQSGRHLAALLRIWRGAQESESMPTVRGRKSTIEPLNPDVVGSQILDYDAIGVHIGVAKFDPITDL